MSRAGEGLLCKCSDSDHDYESMARYCYPATVDKLESKIHAQSEQLKKLINFSRWVIQEGPFLGCDVDGSDIQDKAAELGLLEKTKYDPEVHGSSDYCDAEPGDPWFVFTSVLDEI